MGRIDQLTRTAKNALRRSPLRVVYERIYEHKFATAKPAHLFRGIYKTFPEAIASAPKTKPVGYDHPDPASMYANRRVFPEDYAVLFWLRTLATEGTRLFDYGGHAGGMFDAFRRIWSPPSGFQWVVYDVPAVVEAGRRLNEERNRSGIAFTTEWSDASGTDLFLASGSLQYVEEPLASRLERLERLPRHLIVNQLPLHDEHEFCTLQSIGTAFCPYWIFKRDAFFQSLERLGYSLVDEWENLGKCCHIPLHPEFSVEWYTGACLRLA